VRVIAVPPLLEFGRAHADSEEAIRAWVAMVRGAEWSTFSDITAQYRTASILGNSRVCFNLKGNRYRLIIAVLFRPQTVLIKFIGTHAEYDRIDALTVEL
jgi:mRNA interferase HigB